MQQHRSHRDGINLRPQPSRHDALDALVLERARRQQSSSGRPVRQPSAGRRMLTGGLRSSVGSAVWEVDVDSMTYEELLALEERVGVVEVGVSPRIVQNLPTWRIHLPRPDLTCAVCLEHATRGDCFRCLPCRHSFHQRCIDTWLKSHIKCPVCNADISELGDALISHVDGLFNQLTYPSSP